MADASWPAMLCEMGSCGWNDPSTLVEILTGPDFLPNGSLTSFNPLLDREVVIRP